MNRRCAASCRCWWRHPGEVDLPLADSDIPDDRLRLVFTCCHPALAREAQVALTLRLICGLTTAEIARAFLVSEPTMAARVTRAKKKIAAARIPYRVPEAADLPDRLDAVLTVVHLVFTTGHTAPVGTDLVRTDLVERSIDLCRMLRLLMPDEPEVRGLLALMLLTDARRDARVGPDGSMVLLEDQDRSRWDRAAIDEGLTLVSELLRGSPGRFGLQAAIAAVHAIAPSYARDRLATTAPALRRAGHPVAQPRRRAEPDRAAADGGRAGSGTGRGRAARGRRSAGRLPLPRRRRRPTCCAGCRATRRRPTAYRDALELVDNDTERAYLESRLAALSV